MEQCIATILKDLNIERSILGHIALVLVFNGPLRPCVPGSDQVFVAYPARAFRRVEVRHGKHQRSWVVRGGRVIDARPVAVHIPISGRHNECGQADIVRRDRDGSPHGIGRSGLFCSSPCQLGGCRAVGEEAGWMSTWVDVRTALDSGTALVPLDLNIKSSVEATMTATTPRTA
jgi:hypothetical protein